MNQAHMMELVAQMISTVNISKCQSTGSTSISPTSLKGKWLYR